MTRIFRIVLLFSILILQNCVVTERMVVTDDGSGEFEVTYDLSNMSEVLANMMPSKDEEMEDMNEYDDKDSGDSEEVNKVLSESENGREVVDTLIVFEDLFVRFRDSIAALPEQDRKTLENLRGMYMRMKINEPKEEFKMSIGMGFDSFDDLRDIQKRVKEARDLNSRDSGMDNMTDNSPFSGLMGNEEDEVVYELTTSRFSRYTIVKRDSDSLKEAFDEMEKSDGEFKDTFKESTYVISYTFPKRIKSTSIEDAEISDDRKTVTYSASWVRYLADPEILDVLIEFEDE